MQNIKKCTCGSSPELKRLESERWIVACPQCKQYGEPWASQNGAIARWNRAQVTTLCLGCNSLPRAIYLSSKMWIMSCRGCFYHTNPSMTLDGAMVDWVIQNRPNDSATINLWRDRASKLTESKTEKAGEAA